MIVFGKNGQLGRAFQVLFQNNPNVIFIDRQQCDLSNPLQIQQILDQYQPQIIFNAAAYTAVDLAEKESEIAFAINATAPELMARYISQIPNGVLVHYSTDYVFDGQKSTPYEETDLPNPLSQYGKSKLAGEIAIEKAFQPIMEDGSQVAKYFILRTSWVYGDGSNFIKTMLKLAQEREQLKVVADQFGVPTSAQWLAQLGHQLIQSSIPSGIYHAVPLGETSWHQLACFVIQMAKELQIPLKISPEAIQAIPATEYPLPAPRPYNSRMYQYKLQEALKASNIDFSITDWQEPVREYVKKILLK